MKKSISFYFLLMVFISVLFPFTTQAKPKAIVDGPKIDYVFIQTAKSGKITYDDDTKIYTVTLYDVDPWVTYISSDSKHRITGFLDINSFLQAWQAEATKKSDSEMLNSAIVAMQSGNNKMMNLPIAVKQPTYDSQNNNITYPIKELEGAKHNPLPKEAVFKHVALFIDDVCITCVGRRF